MVFLAFAAVTAIVFLFREPWHFFQRILPLTLTTLLQPALLEAPVLSTEHPSPFTTKIPILNSSIPSILPLPSTTKAPAPQSVFIIDTGEAATALALYVPQPHISCVLCSLLPQVKWMISVALLSILTLMILLIIFFLLDYASRAVTGLPMFERFYTTSTIATSDLLLPYGASTRNLVADDVRGLTHVSPRTIDAEDADRITVLAPRPLNISHSVISEESFSASFSNIKGLQSGIDSSAGEMMYNITTTPSTDPIALNSQSSHKAFSFSFRRDTSTPPLVENHLRAPESPKFSHGFSFSFPLQSEHNVFKSFEMPRSPHHFSFRPLPLANAISTVRGSGLLQPMAVHQSEPRHGEGLGAGNAVFDFQYLSDDDETTGDPVSPTDGKLLNSALVVFRGQDCEVINDSEPPVQGQDVGGGGDCLTEVPEDIRPDEGESHDTTDPKNDFLDCKSLKRVEVALQYPPHSSLGYSLAGDSSSYHPLQPSAIPTPELRDHEGRDVENKVSDIQGLRCNSSDAIPLQSVPLNSAFHHPECEGPGDVEPYVDTQVLSCNEDNFTESFSAEQPDESQSCDIVALEQLSSDGLQSAEMTTDDVPGPTTPLSEETTDVVALVSTTICDDSQVGSRFSPLGGVEFGNGVAAGTSVGVSVSFTQAMAEDDGLTAEPDEGQIGAERRNEPLQMPAAEEEDVIESQERLTTVDKGKSKENPSLPIAVAPHAFSDCILTAAQIESNNKPHSADSPNWALAPPDPVHPLGSSSTTHSEKKRGDPRGAPRNPGNPNPQRGYRMRKYARKP